MPEHGSGYVQSVNMMLDDDLHPSTHVLDHELDEGHFFFRAGSGVVQVTATPELLETLGYEMLDAAHAIGLRLAANRDARDARNTAAMNGWPDLPGLATS